MSLSFDLIPIDRSFWAFSVLRRETEPLVAMAEISTALELWISSYSCRLCEHGLIGRAREGEIFRSLFAPALSTD